MNIKFENGSEITTLPSEDIHRGTGVALNLVDLYEGLLGTYEENMREAGKSEEEIDETLADLIDDLVKIMEE